MGLFDLLNPVLLSFDDLVGAYTTSFVRLSLWALISALVTSLIFKKLSNPDKISHLKTTLKQMQNQLSQHDGEFSELKGLAIDTIKLSIKRMLLTFFPAMLASLPMLFILTYLSNHYEFQQPQLNDSIGININWNDNQNQELSVVQGNKTIQSGIIESINWPATNSPIHLTTNDMTIMTFPINLSGIIHKKLWWNALIGNPAGYLNNNSQVTSIQFKFKTQKIINFGPNWMHGWLFVYFFMTFAFSIGFLFLFKIKF